MMVMAGSEPLIDIVIPTWNGRLFLGDCLQSLRRQTCDGFRVIVVDNGSSDGSCEYLRTSFPEVEVVSLPENTGFSYAVNAGISASRAPLILLLNNDMEVAEDCVERLKEALERYPDIDAFALKMINFHQRHLLDGAGDAFLRGGVGYRLGTMEEDGPLYQKDRPVFGACAGAALYRRDFFATVGLFDPGFFAYLEDVDLNLRARRLGKRFMYLSSAKVYHLGSATSGSKFNPLTIRLSTRNNILVLAKNYPLPIFFRFLPAILVYQVVWLLFCLKKGLVAPYLQGLFQGLVSWPRFRRKADVLFRQDKLLSLDIFAALLKEAEKEVIHSIMDRRSAIGKSNNLLRLYRKLFLS
jgi:GT2 family glycosyltransferase